MNSPKIAATNVGRIGALAVALGVGAAVTGGTGLAWADTPTQQDTSTASAHDAGTAGKSTAGRVNRDAAPASSGSPAAPSAGARRGGVLSAAAVSPPSAARNRTTPTTATSAPVPAAVPVTTTVPDSATVVSVPAPVPSVAGFLTPVSTSTNDASALLTARLTVPVVRAVAAPRAAALKPAPPLAATTQAVSATPTSLWSRLLTAARLAALGAGSAPGAPANSPSLWALLAWARRDRAAATQPAATVTQTSTLTSTPIGWVTGQRNTGYPGAGWAQTNNTKWANVYGTDLGIMWFNGVNGLTQLAFGDTFSGANQSGDWRSNILLLSNDTNLTDGLSLMNTGPAYQFIPAAKNQVFFIGSEVTNIPTSALYADANNYVSYMSVKSWDSPGRWTTNYSAISQYDPATDKWVLQPSTIRSAGWFRAQKGYVAGDQNFQQMAYVLEPDSQVAPGGTRYVYAFGTPAGRAGSAFLSRVPENAVTDLKQYQYWDGSTWVSNQAKAAPVLGDSNKSTGLFGPIIDLANNPNFLGGQLAGFTGAKTGGNVSEMSVQYNDYLGKYVALYGNGANNVILRTADTPEGPWSAPITIATSIQYPGLYAPMIHPLSGTGQLTDSSGNPDVSHLYWNMSIWGNYNVALMQTDLAPLKATLA